VAADTLAPVLGTLRRAKGRIRFGLSEAASVRIQIQRAVIVRGHKRWRTTSTLVRRGVKGKNAVRIPKVAAKRGAYRAVARATDAAGNRSAVRRLAFRVKR
jgi:hypothetical protein